MKILIIGARGMLGSNLCLMYSKDKSNDIYATGIPEPDFKFCENYKFDITDEKDFDIIRKINPDLVINCAAIIDVDFCENNFELSYKVNAIGPKNLARHCKEIGAYFVHISSDAVFDGTKDGKYTEEDTPSPISKYGKTKLDSEKFINEVGGDAVVIRTTIYGWNMEKKFSLSEWMLDKLEKNEKFSGISDVYFTPILVNNLGSAIMELYNLRYKGILNIAGSEAISKLEFGQKIAEVFSLNSSIIKPVRLDEMNFSAKRSKNMTLDITKAKKILKTKLLGVKDGLEEFRSLRENGFLEELKTQNG